MHVAVNRKVVDIKLVRYLISKGIKADEKNKFGHTSLYYAYLNKNEKVISELIKSGASNEKAYIFQL